MGTSTFTQLQPMIQNGHLDFHTAPANDTEWAPRLSHSSRAELQALVYDILPKVPESDARSTSETYDATSNGRGWKKAVINMQCDVWHSLSQPAGHVHNAHGPRPVQSAMLNSALQPCVCPSVCVSVRACVCVCVSVRACMCTCVSVRA